MSVTLRKAELLRPSPRTWNKGRPPWVKMAYLWNNQLADWCNHCKYNDKDNDKDENKGDDNDRDEDSDKDKGQGQGKSRLAELICEITSWQIDATIAQSRSASPTTTGAIMLIRTTVELSPCAEKLRLQQIIHSVDSTLSCSNSYTRVLVPRVKHLSSRLGSISEIGHVPILAGGARTRNENNPLKLPSRWQG